MANMDLCSRLTGNVGSMSAEIFYERFNQSSTIAPPLPSSCVWLATMSPSLVISAHIHNQFNVEVVVDSLFVMIVVICSVVGVHVPVVLWG